jgi:hypothetical protein
MPETEVEKVKQPDIRSATGKLCPCGWGFLLDWPLETRQNISSGEYLDLEKLDSRESG